MVLWTMQPLEILELLQSEGVYRCDPARCSMPEFSKQYEWLASLMERKIGPAPEGVHYPVWAWYSQNGKRAKPDLRRERYGYGPGGEQFVCMEIEIPDDQVLLTDFDLWNCVLNDSPIAFTEEESDEFDRVYETLSPEEKQKFKEHNWERILDLTQVDNNWICCGFWVQATFWELRMDQVRKVQYFMTGTRKL